MPNVPNSLLVPVHQVVIHGMGAPGCPYEISDVRISVPRATSSECSAGKGRRTVSVCSNRRGKARRFAYPARSPFAMLTTSLQRPSTKRTSTDREKMFPPLELRIGVTSLVLFRAIRMADIFSLITPECIFGYVCRIIANSLKSPGNEDKVQVTGRQS